MMKLSRACGCVRRISGMLGVMWRYISASLHNSALVAFEIGEIGQLGGFILRKACGDQSGARLRHARIDHDFKTRGTRPLPCRNDALRPCFIAADCYL